MRLKIVTPRKILLDIEVSRIVSEGPDGAFGMLPNHIDFVSQLVPGILTYETTDGTERYAGIRAGTLVKCAEEVLVSTSNAILGHDLESLQDRVQEVFRDLDENEKAARSALARLEAQMVRRFLDLEQSA